VFAVLTHVAAIRGNLRNSRRIAGFLSFADGGSSPIGGGHRRKRNAGLGRSKGVGGDPEGGPKGPEPW
jgi:hypothetical protein